MKKIVLSFILISTLWVLHSQTLKVKWTEIESPASNIQKILSAESFDDFWVNDAFGNLYHKNADSWEKFKLPEANNFTKIFYEKITNTTFFIAAMDFDYKSHFFLFETNKFIKYDFIDELPIQGIVKISKSNFYLYGNFGEFLHFRNGKFTKIQTPIKNHINCIVKVDSANYWFGTRNDGVFSFDGRKFKKIPFADSVSKEIQSIVLTLDGKIAAFATNLNGYIFEDGVFKKVNGAEELNLPRLGEIRGGSVFRSYKNDAGEWITFSYPVDYRVNNYISISDSQFILTSQKDKIYLGTKSVANFFVDHASYYQVDLTPGGRTYGAAFTDFNNDNRIDLFLTAGSNFFSFRLFLNIENKGLAEITQSSGLNSIDKTPYRFILGDINKDGNIDLLFNQFDKTGSKIIFYEGDKNHNFTQKQSINIPDDYSAHTVRNMNLIDIDADGDLDLGLSFYYGPEISSGAEFIIENQWDGKLGSFKPEFQSITNGWNEQSIFADFNGDDQNDWLIINKWRTYKLLMGQNGIWVDESKDRLPKMDNSNGFGGAAVDFDNDADLDIFTITEDDILNILVNDGTGHFSKESDLYKVRLFKESILYSYSSRSISFGDINNDGFIDIFIGGNEPGNSGNLLYLNIRGEKFIESSEDYNVKFPVVEGSIFGDLENDGDLDIFGIGYNKNTLWINNLDNNSYLRIIPHGVFSNIDGISAKVYLYKGHHLNDEEYLLGFRQIGSESYGAAKFNENVAHFGVPPDQFYDVLIKFYGGKEITLKNLLSGQTIHVEESTGFIASLYLLQFKILRSLQQTFVQIYIGLILLSILIIYIGINFGIKKFQWDIKLVLVLVLINMSLFWVITILSNQSTNFLIRYVFPLSALLVGISLPNLIFYWISKKSDPETSAETNNFELLREIMAFTHGEWALRNLNSLLFLCQNLPEKEKLNEKFLRKFDTRKETFLKMTIETIDKVHKLLVKSELNKELAAVLSESKLEVQKNLELIFSGDDDNVNRKAAGAIINSIEKIKVTLKRIKQEQFEKFSSNPVEVIKQITSINRQKLNENHITLKRFRESENGLRVLIRNIELAEVVDNLISNSVDSLNGNNNGEIEVVLYRKPPKVCIDVIDNGIGIEESKWNLIFESGFSGKGSTGLGLYNSKILLNKYGGRIFVKQSRRSERTILTIELNEVANDQSSSFNH